jgi:hypothetical protein
MQSLDAIASDATSRTGSSPIAGAVIRWVLLLPVAISGLWALLAPASFFADFPGFGLHWVVGDGLINEHLTVDVGALSLALVAVTLAAGPRWTLGLVVGWQLYALPHLGYHLFHLQALSGMLDRVTSVVSLVAIVVLPVAGLLVERRSRL